MKKWLIAAAAGLFLLAGTFAFAQQQTNPPPNPKTAYYKVIPILKLWVHPLGYMIQFYSSKSEVSEIYIPLKWFNLGIYSKADLIYGTDRSYPYATIFWVDGKFDHINVYALDNLESPTWGVLENVTDRSSKFNLEEVPKDF